MNKNKAALIVQAMKARVELCNLEAHLDNKEQQMLDGITHSANASVSVISNNDAISNAALMSGYDHYFREVTIRIVNQAADILGKESVDHEILADVAETVVMFLRRIFGHEKYKDLLSPPLSADSLERNQNKCVMLSVYFAIKEGVLCWTAFTNSMEIDPEDGFSYKVVDLVEDWNDVEKELKATENQYATMKTTFEIPVGKSGETGRSGLHYPPGTYEEAIKTFTKKVESGQTVYGELRSAGDPIASMDCDVAQAKSVDREKISHQIDSLFMKEDVLMAKITTVSSQVGGALAVFMQGQDKIPNFSEMMSFGIRGTCNTKVVDGIKHVSNLNILSIDAIYDMTKDPMKLKAEE